MRRFPHRHGDATGKPETRDETRGCRKNEHFVRDVVQFYPILIFSTCYQTGWNVTKCHPCHAKRHDNLLGNLRKRHILQLPPYRHGDATGKPETRDETRRCRKTSISCETSSNFDIFDTLSNRLECQKVPRLPRKTT